MASCAFAHRATRGGRSARSRRPAPAGPAGPGRPAPRDDRRPGARPRGTAPAAPPATLTPAGVRDAARPRGPCRDTARSRRRIRPAVAGREGRRADAARSGRRAAAPALRAVRGRPTPGPLLVYFHGGGWVLCDLDTHDQTCRFIAREAGVRVLAVDYRLAPEHPFPGRRRRCRGGGALRDRARPGGWGPTLPGSRSGATARAATLPPPRLACCRRTRVRAPAFQLLIYPVTDLSRKRRSYQLFQDGFFLTERQMDWYRDHYLPTADAALDPRASPLLADDLAASRRHTSRWPGSTCCATRARSTRARLREAGVPVTVRRHAGLVHGFCNTVNVGRASRAAMLEVTAALRAGLAPEPLSGEEARQQLADLLRRLLLEEVPAVGQRGDLGLRQVRFTRAIVSAMSGRIRSCSP